jgi:hypothetical protein
MLASSLDLRNVTRIEIGDIFRSDDKMNTYRVIRIKGEHDQVVEITLNSNEYSIPVILGEE